MAALAALAPIACDRRRDQLRYKFPNQGPVKALGARDICEPSDRGFSRGIAGAGARSITPRPCALTADNCGPKIAGCGGCAHRALTPRVRTKDQYSGRCPCHYWRQRSAVMQTGRIVCSSPLPPAPLCPTPYRNSFRLRASSFDWAKGIDSACPWAPSACASPGLPQWRDALASLCRLGIRGALGPARLPARGSTPEWIRRPTRTRAEDPGEGAAVVVF